ncbi:Putative phosphatidylcholine:ceramide cholinephosphotransferase 3 [Toxocara canis]|uniref:Putative phosphatidylcholine:ceramide cholinephosphotransferase 3 n=1 Tax=Toxocara canis TaxID=6265 RepID=A0A0B2W5P4_TOXCA|nr:Putative phosphatidylcholine:ceramide cholinephosphotransferase 3 [Toxocara canis]
MKEPITGRQHNVQSRQCKQTVYTERPSSSLLVNAMRIVAAATRSITPPRACMSEMPSTQQTEVQSTTAEESDFVATRSGHTSPKSKGMVVEERSTDSEKPKHKRASQRILDAVKRAARIAASQSARPVPSEQEISKDIVYPLEWHKTIATFVALVFALILNCMALATAHDVVSRNALPDLFFSLIAQQDWALEVGDVLCSSAMVLNALPDLFFSLIAQQDWALEVGDVLCSSAMVLSVLFITVFHKHRFIVLRRMAYSMSVLYVMRAFCICVTHIPTSYQNNAKKCIKPNHDPDVASILLLTLKLSYQFGLQVENRQGRLMCGDQLFSGHTILVSTTTFYLNHYTPHSVWPLRWVLILTCIIGMACLFLSRTHYTVDVMISYWLSSLMFSIYHAFVSMPHSMRLRARAYRRLIFYWTMFVLEVNVPSGRLPNELEWPFPAPKCVKNFVENWSNRNCETKAGQIADFIDAHRLNTHL